jgi:hypothetical protein
MEPQGFRSVIHSDLSFRFLVLYSHFTPTYAESQYEQYKQFFPKVSSFSEKALGSFMELIFLWNKGAGSPTLGTRFIEIIHRNTKHSL